MNTILTDLIPAKARKYVYALLSLAAVAYGAWQAADGDWKQTVGSLLVLIVGATAVSNTDVVSEETPVATDLHIHVPEGYTERSQLAREVAQEVSRNQGTETST